MLYFIWNSFGTLISFLGVNSLASLGGLNNMGSLASMSALNSNQVASHALVPAGTELHPGILKAVTSSLSNGQHSMTAPSNISAEQWESACSGAEQFVGKTVICAFSGPDSLIKCIGKHCSSTSCLLTLLCLYCFPFFVVLNVFFFCCTCLLYFLFLFCFQQEVEIVSSCEMTE